MKKMKKSLGMLWYSLELYKVPTARNKEIIFHPIKNSPSLVLIKNT